MSLLKDDSSPVKILLLDDETDFLLISKKYLERNFPHQFTMETISNPSLTGLLLKPLIDLALGITFSSQNLGMKAFFCLYPGNGSTFSVHIPDILQLQD